jgi:hypothetical protein
LTSSGKADVRLQIAHADFPAPSSGDGNRSHGIAALGRLGRLLHFALNGCERIRTMPFANSSNMGLVGASLVAAAFLLCAMSDTNPSLLGYVCASLVAAAFHLRAVPDTNSALFDYVCASLVAAAVAFHLRTMPSSANPALLGYVCASIPHGCGVLSSRRRRRQTIVPSFGRKLVVHGATCVAVCRVKLAITRKCVVAPKQEGAPYIPPFLAPNPVSSC